MRRRGFAGAFPAFSSFLSFFDSSNSRKFPEWIADSIATGSAAGGGGAAGAGFGLTGGSGSSTRVRADGDTASGAGNGIASVGAELRTTPVPGATPGSRVRLPESPGTGLGTDDGIGLKITLGGSAANPETRIIWSPISSRSPSASVRSLVMRTPFSFTPLVLP